MLSSALILATVMLGTTMVAQDVHYFAKPDDITVYQRGAAIHIIQSVAMKKGSTRIIFDSLPAGIDINTIRASVGRAGTISNIEYRQEPDIQINSIPTPPRKNKVLEDSLERLNFELEDSRNRVNTLESEERLIINFRLEPGKEKNASVAELQQLAELYSGRIKEIKSEILNQKIKQNGMNKKIKNIQDLIAELSGGTKEIRPRTVNYQIVLDINTNVASTADLSLSYFTQNAGWQPAYDVNIAEIEKPVKILMKARVWQNTGMDWKEIKVICSSRNPDQNAVIPVLNPWLLRILPPVAVREAGSKVQTLSLRSASMDPRKPARAMNTMDDNENENTESAAPPELSSIESKYLAIDYTPNGRFTIPGNGIQQQLPISETELKGEYQYICVPKIDPDAFLVAKLPNLSENQFLPGEAFIYFDGTFVGKSMLGNTSTEDSLMIGLGRDREIIVRREQIKEYTSRRFLSSSAEYSHGYQIVVKNTRKTRISITIEDQVPISTNEKIEVKVQDISGAELDKERGTVRWKLDIAPGSTAKKTLQYMIIAPRDIRMY
jgi:uncharacterized protein (TIGR02231 family)